MKPNECREYNLKYAIMAAIMLHNLCILVYPCEPRWMGKVSHISLKTKFVDRETSKKAADRYRMKIANWLWSVNN